MFHVMVLKETDICFFMMVFLSYSFVCNLNKYFYIDGETFDISSGLWLTQNVSNSGMAHQFVTWDLSMQVTWNFIFQTMQVCHKST